MPSTQRIQTHNKPRHNTTTASQTLVYAGHTLSLPTTTHTTATKTQTHITLSPCSSRMGKVQHQSSHPLTPTPPTPSRAKYIHMSHTPPTPLTTLISSRSPALDRDPTPALSSPSHPHILAAHTHETQTTVHASH